MKHDFLINGNRAATEGDRARCARCGLTITARVGKVGAEGAAETFLVMTGWRIGSEWTALTPPRRFTEEDEWCLGS